MKTNKLIKNTLAASIAAAGLASLTAHAYGPLYIYDYSDGTPYRWDVTEPVQVWVDGGNFASGTVTLYVSTPETCNADDGWQCGYYEETYVEFTNEQGVARVSEALASWSAVPTSSFQAWARTSSAMRSRSATQSSGGVRPARSANCTARSTVTQPMTLE